ncbi:MAG: signal peptidase I [Bacteroidales bacterium]|nr:signal peptidase I [Bacteroidales bacterium]
MNIYEILLLIALILCTIGLWKIFEKAGEKNWKALIPLYNIFICLRIADKHKKFWWYFFLITPFINVFMIMLLIVEIIKHFGKFSLGQEALAVLFPYIYLPYLGFSSKEKYCSTKDLPVIKKTVVREWVDAIIFAVIAATIIRTFLIEAYTIPTSSMEKSLLVGDFLFVSKISYGPRVPETPLSFPFTHHTLPLTKYTKSYLEWIKLPYYRFHGLEKIKNNDVVVFNYPDGDTVANKIQSNESYYSLVRRFGRNRVWQDKYTFGDIIARPVDKRENFIKRCIAISGDTLQIINQKVFINGKENINPGKKQFQYIVTTDGSRINPKALERLDITETVMTIAQNKFLITLTDEAAEKLKHFVNVKSVEQYIQPKGKGQPYIFPFDTTYKWNVDNYGPIVIPKAGATISVNTKNICLYKRIINVFEDNDLKIKDNKIFINGKETNTYTFKMNYYWMMGDNRHNSADSRFWGFVPEDHIVGKAIFVWLSLDKNKSLFDGKIRWRKLFRVI